MTSTRLQSLLDHVRRLHGDADGNQRNDRELLHAYVASNDQEAFTILVRRHAALVWGVCRRILQHRQDAEDAFQATFLILARRAGSIQWRSSVGGWLHTVAQRLAVRVRQQTEQRRAHERVASRMPSGDPGLHELAAVVDEEIRRLPARYREPILLHYLDGMTAEAAAHHLGLSRAGFYHRLKRGLDLLRARFQRQGSSLAAPLVAAALTSTGRAAPPWLMAATLRGVAGNVPERVAWLAAQMTTASAALKTSIGLVLALLVGLAAGGMAMRRFAANSSPPQSPRPADPPAALAAKSTPHVDRYGDPLPDGAVTRLGSLRFRVDTYEIKSLAFAPDGKTIAVQGDSGIWLLDAVSGKQLRRVSQYGSSKAGIAFSPDGSQLLAPCQVAELDANGKVIHAREKVRVWDKASGRPLWTSDLSQPSWVGWIGSSPSAAYVGTGALVVRDLITRRERRFALPNPVSPWACSCVAQKTLLVASDQNGRIHLWGMADGTERHVLQSGGSLVRSLSLSADGRWLASLAENRDGTHTVCLWDTAMGRCAHRLATDQKYLHAIALAADGKTLLTVGWLEIRVWDTGTGRLRHRLKSPSGVFGNAVAVTKDNRTLATTVDYCGAVHLWDLAAGTLKPEPSGHSGWPTRPSFSADGTRVATAGSADGTIWIWDPATGTPLVHIRRPRWVRDCAFSADGRILYSSWTDDKLYFDDSVTGHPLRALEIRDPERPKPNQRGLSLQLSDDRRRLVVFSTGNNQEDLITGWDAATGKRLFHRRRINDASVISPDGRTLAAPCPAMGQQIRAELVLRRLRRGLPPDGQSLRLEDTATGEPFLTIPCPEGFTKPLAFSPDGRLLASTTNSPPPPPARGSWRDTVRVWDLLTGRQLFALPLSSNPYKMAAFSPDGRLLTTCDHVGEILLYDLAAGRELRRFKHLGAQITTLAFSLNGRQLVSGLSDSTLLVWDVAKPAAAPTYQAGARDIARAWTDLASEDAVRAFRARWLLVSTPMQTLALLKSKLPPAKAVEPSRLRDLIASLNDKRFRVREKAQAELQKLGPLAEFTLRQALAGNLPLEVRRRIQALLRYVHGPVTQPELLRSLRALAILEDIGTPAAREVLKDLAKGAPGARLTREAAAVLARLKRFPHGLHTALQQPRSRSGLLANSGDR